MPKPAAKSKALDINTCSAQQLLDLKLKGLSDKKATALVDYRRKCGPYQDWTSVLLVDGIGPESVSKLQLAGVVLSEAAAATSRPLKPASSPCFGSPAKSRSQKQQPGTHSVSASSTSADPRTPPAKQSTGIFKCLFGQHQPSPAGQTSKLPAGFNKARPHSTQADIPAGPAPAKASRPAPSKPAQTTHDVPHPAEVRWWQVCGNPAAPFPPEFAVSKKQIRSYDYVRIAPGDAMRMVYKGQLLTQQEAAEMQEAWKQR